MAMISLVKLLADFIKIWYDKFKKRLEMSTINVNDGSINFGYKNIKDFTTLDSATDVQYLLATQDNSDGCKILKETLIDYIGTQGGFATQEALDTKQPLLVSGQNLKTINGVSLLDSGNITIAQGDMINDSAPSLNTAYSSSKVESVTSDVFALFEDKYCINKPTDKWVEGGTGEWLSNLDYPKAWEGLNTYIYITFFKCSVSQGSSPVEYIYRKMDSSAIGDDIYDENLNVIGVITRRAGAQYVVKFTGSSTEYYYNSGTSIQMQDYKYPHKKTTETYTDYDIVVNETAQTFRLPIKPKSKIVIDSGYEKVNYFDVNWIIYSDRSYEVYGRYIKPDTSRTVDDSIFHKYDFKNDDKYTITVTPALIGDYSGAAPIGNCGIKINTGFNTISTYVRIYGYSSTDVFNGFTWHEKGTLADSVQLPNTALKTYYYLG